jgi:hypothetical protein
MSDIAAQSKRTTSRQKSLNNIEVEPEFDGSEYISIEKPIGKRMKSSDSEKSNVQQPRQPKKERSLTLQSDQVKFFEKINIRFSLFYV